MSRATRPESKKVAVRAHTAPDDATDMTSVDEESEPAGVAAAGGKNSNLMAAKSAKNDEFYTQWVDIEREMNAYIEYDPDVFRDKVVLLPCDDPEWSNFAKFFALHFTDYGIKKLISTSYAANSKPANINYQPTLFETEAPQYDEARTRTNGKMFVLDREDVTGDGVVNIDDLQWRYLDGDGDFRSAEVTALRDEADFVITNPPFSLFRPFLAWLVEGDVKFSVIGHQNAITYKEIFPLIRDSKTWLGKGFKGNATHFGSPYDDVAVATDRQPGMIRVSGVMWFTNIEHGRRHERLELMTEAENIKFSKHKEVRGVGYQRYDNYDAIEVPFTDAIPSDYDGTMGVPVTFLDRYNPDQFEILGSEKDWDAGKVKMYPKQVQVTAAGKRSNVTKLNDGAALVLVAPPKGETYYEVDSKVYTQVYKRIFIRRKVAS